MLYTRAELKAIYDRTGGYCHLCHGKMYFSNYGLPDARGGWEVDHSRPRASGGTDHGNNLYGAHISCNRDKGALSSRAARARHGTTRAPKSREQRQDEKREIRFIVGAGLAVVGLSLLSLLANRGRPQSPPLGR